MAGGSRLRTLGGRLLALLAVVALLHALALQWLAQQLDLEPMLRPLPTPIFTRLLQPQAPTAVPAPKARSPARPKVRRVAARSIAAAKVPPAHAASQPASAPAVAAAAPEVAPPLPAPEAIAAAKPPEPAASAAPPAVAAAPAALDSWPADTRLNYRLGGQFRNGELHGSARVQWQRQGERYETRIEIDVTLLASLVLTSQGEVTAQGLFPRAYEELRRSGPRAARLGNDDIGLADGRTVPRPAGVQDTASQFVELSHRFATGQDALEVGRSVSLWLARPGGVDLWTYDVAERETLQTAGLGAVEAFHLKPRSIANPRGNITAEMWFAPSLQYLPVRIRVNMGEGAFVDLMVERIEQR
ncbi:MAG: hypothetical protein JWQ07_2380 [Ramlibacter sp.]|nr:hypothetical protein [Ramlibacter sp.]